GGVEEWTAQRGEGEIGARKAIADEVAPARQQVVRPFEDSVEDCAIGGRALGPDPVHLTDGTRDGGQGEPIKRPSPPGPTLREQRNDHLRMTERVDVEGAPQRLAELTVEPLLELSRLRALGGRFGREWMLREARIAVIDDSARALDRLLTVHQNRHRCLLGQA